MQDVEAAAAVAGAVGELKIAEAESYLLRVPIEALQADSQSRIEAWDVLVVKLVSSSGQEGWGFQTGFGAAMEAVKVLIDRALLPAMIGKDARDHKLWWQQLYLGVHHMGLGGPILQGVSAPEIAAWDMMARAAGVPLWMLLGGRCRERVMVYDTNCGLYGHSKEELVEKVKASVDRGFRGIKMKIGAEDFGRDLERLEALRQAVGDEIMIATDVNNGWDLQRALERAPYLEDYDVTWIEEPLYPFDVDGHAELAAAISTPLIHGESLCEPLMFRDMLDAGAMDIVQPSDMKLGGIGRWMEVAALARTAGKRVVPAGWSKRQIDQHLAAATPHCWMVESITWVEHIFQEPVRIEEGDIIISEAPGASTAIKAEALEQYAIG